MSRSRKLKLVHQQIGLVELHMVTDEEISFKVPDDSNMVWIFTVIILSRLPVIRSHLQDSLPSFRG
uniref:Uncharacterized protein n=1 Tax=Arundo donax TaxID=35708 RepID=A0A0A9HPA0_ARUDO